MSRKRHSGEDILKPLREIELYLSGGADVASDRLVAVAIARRRVSCVYDPGRFSVVPLRTGRRVIQIKRTQFGSA
jgi:hypothetical protein